MTNNCAVVMTATLNLHLDSNHALSNFNNIGVKNV